MGGGGGGGYNLCTNFTYFLTCGELVRLFFRCEELVPYFHMCAKLVPHPHTITGPICLSGARVIKHKRGSHREPPRVYQIREKFVCLFVCFSIGFALPNYI